jgi:hypothetical protein
MDERNFHESDGIAFNLNGSIMRSVDGKLYPIIGQSNFTYSYNRKKGKKILLSGNANGEFIMHTESVLQGYENIFAIDTNTKNINGNKISVAVIVHAYLEEIEEGFILYHTAFRAFEFWNASIPSERLGWYALVGALLANTSLADRYTGIIVDSDLDELDEINLHQKCIYNDLMLPENFKLIYASSDSGANGVNKLIKLCDRRSNEVLEYIREHSSIENLTLSTEYPCEYFRQWQFN